MADIRTDFPADVESAAVKPVKKDGRIIDKRLRIVIETSLYDDEVDGDLLKQIGLCAGSRVEVQMLKRDDRLPLWPDGTESVTITRSSGTGAEQTAASEEPAAVGTDRDQT